MDDWLVFYCVVPQLEITYELRLKFISAHAWDAMVFMGGQLQGSFSGDDDTSSGAMWEMVFAAIGVTDLMVPIGD